VAETTAPRHPHLSVVLTVKEHRRAKLTKHQQVRQQHRSEIMNHFLNHVKQFSKKSFRLTTSSKN
jgi:hypothetical protein